MSRSRRVASQLAKPPSVGRIFRFFDDPAPVEQDSPPVSRFSEELRGRVQSLKLTAAHHQLVSLASNQCQTRNFRMFVVNRRAAEVGAWASREYGDPDDFEEFLNPKVVEASQVLRRITKESESQPEQCPSVPYLLANISRFRTVGVQYYDMHKELRGRQLSGFEARVFQHELDHTFGKLITYLELNHGELSLDPPVAAEFPKTEYILEELRKKSKELLADYPQTIKSPTVRSLNGPLPPLEVSFEIDLLRRLGKRMKKEVALHEARQQLGL